MNLSDFIAWCERISNFTDMVDIHNLIRDLKKINESQKVTVPQFVGDYIKYAIENDWDFQDLFKRIEDEEDEELMRWVYHERNQETLAAAWIDGYEVKKEKRYLVKMKNLRALFCYLAYIPDEGYWTFMASGGKALLQNTPASSSKKPDSAGCLIVKVWKLKRCENE